MNKKLKNFLITVLLGLTLLIIVIVGIDLLTGGKQIESWKVSISNFFNKDSQSQNTVVDNTPIQLEYSATSLTVYEKTTSFALISNKEISTDSTKAKLFLVKQPSEEDKRYWYAVEVQNVPVGTYNFSMDVKDAAGNTKKVFSAITRQSYSLPFGLSEIVDWEGSIYTVDGDNLLAKVDKGHKLTADYEPKELLDINKDLLLYTNSPSSILIEREAGEALKIMAKALQKEKGKNLVIMSGYRTYNDQYTTYAGWVKSLGQEEADKTSARPGFSEHQLGRVVDFVDQETGLNLTNNFDNGVAGKWLKDNAHKYGYVQSYPVGKESVTGYQHEAWHWRYVGIDNATNIKQSGLTLKEWLDKGN